MTVRNHALALSFSFSDIVAVAIAVATLSITLGIYFDRIKRDNVKKLKPVVNDIKNKLATCVKNTPKNKEDLSAIKDYAGLCQILEGAYVSLSQDPIESTFKRYTGSIYDNIKAIASTVSSSLTEAKTQADKTKSDESALLVISSEAEN